ncbi:MAG: 16S rRNA (uracil(1498)-N(3))-methyltransferase [Nocardioidaceae bacterium]
MTSPLFVVGTEALAGDEIELAGTEGHHAAAVKRLRRGELLTLTDGEGTGAECEVVSVSRHGLVARVLARRREPQPQPRLVVVQAIPKGDQADSAVDLLTEVGADVIVPWAAERNIVSWRGDRGARGRARWSAVAYAAAKQSRRLRFPEVAQIHSTDDVVGLVSGSSLAFVLHGGAGPDGLTDLVASQGDVVLVVGPEGGLTDHELGVLTAAGARALRLGPTVLRSSSAGFAAASLVLSRTPRWS